MREHKDPPPPHSLPHPAPTFSSTSSRLSAWRRAGGGLPPAGGWVSPEPPSASSPPRSNVSRVSKRLERDRGPPTLAAGQGVRWGALHPRGLCPPPGKTTPPEVKLPPPPQWVKAPLPPLGTPPQIMRVHPPTPALLYLGVCSQHHVSARGESPTGLGGGKGTKLVWAHLKRGWKTPLKRGTPQTGWGEGSYQSQNRHLPPHPRGCGSAPSWARPDPLGGHGGGVGGAPEDLQRSQRDLGGALPGQKGKLVALPRRLCPGGPGARRSDSEFLAESPTSGSSS